MEGSVTISQEHVNPRGNNVPLAVSVEISKGHRTLYTIVVNRRCKCAIAFVEHHENTTTRVADRDKIGLVIAIQVPCRNSDAIREWEIEFLRCQKSIVLISE